VVGWTEESVGETIEEEVPVLLMAEASLSASNEMATEAREIDVYTMVVFCDKKTNITYLQVCREQSR
jgi:hypothetical protein